jgi:hypothetical protein
VIASQIGYAQVLQALAQLAPRLGLPEGLEGWEKLAQQFREGGDGNGAPENGEESELEQIQQYMSGIQEPDLSQLPAEWAKLVKAALEK